MYIYIYINRARKNPPHPAPFELHETTRNYQAKPPSSEGCDKCHWNGSTTLAIAMSAWAPPRSPPNPLEPKVDQHAMEMYLLISLCWDASNTQGCIFPRGGNWPRPQGPLICLIDFCSALWTRRMEQVIENTMRTSILNHFRGNNVFI